VVGAGAGLGDGLVGPLHRDLAEDARAAAARADVQLRADAVAQLVAPVGDPPAE
jgi:hypothetical protein